MDLRLQPDQRIDPSSFVVHGGSFYCFVGRTSGSDGALASRKLHRYTLRPDSETAVPIIDEKVLPSKGTPSLFGVQQ